MLTGIHNSLDKIVPRNQAVVVLVHLSEEICQSGLLMIHELQELKIKVNTN